MSEQYIARGNGVCRECERRGWGATHPLTQLGVKLVEDEMRELLRDSGSFLHVHGH
jgi:hypothetical protein